MWIYLLLIVVSFFLGYRFCLLRWQPKRIIELTKLLTAVINKTITPEEALKKAEEFEKEF